MEKIGNRENCLIDNQVNKKKTKKRETKLMQKKIVTVTQKKSKINKTMVKCFGSEATQKTQILNIIISVIVSAKYFNIQE